MCYNHINTPNTAACVHIPVGPHPPPRLVPRPPAAPALAEVPSPPRSGTRQMPPHPACFVSHIIIFPLNINDIIPAVCLLPAVLPVSSSPLGQKLETISLRACTPFVMFKVISSSPRWIAGTSLLIININKSNKY